MISSLINRIDKKLPELPKAEKKVGEYIKNNPRLVPGMTVKELSAESKVSEASITRFCKSIGISNFKIFKMELAKELTMLETNITDFSILYRKDTPYNIFNNVKNVNKLATDLLTRSLDKKELERAVEALVQSRNIVFCGFGGSATAAFDGYYKFTKLGYQTLLSNDVHFVASAIPYLTKQDVFIALSVSGRTNDVLRLTDFAKKKGLTIIAITNIDKTPLYKSADIRLCTPVVEADVRTGTIPSSIAQLNIIDTLYLSVLHRISKKVVSRLYEARDMLSQIRE